MPTTDFPPSLRTRYEPAEELGRGAFGVVLRARDRDLDREVALKLLHPDPRSEALRRFEREARVLARLEHPHVVRVFDHGIADGVPYLVSELLVGHTLEDSRPGAPLEVMLDVADGLDAAHRLGVVHRDVKPANVLVADTGRGVLLDFGLVQGRSSHSLTRTGARVGTLLYMAPEVVRGEASTPAADWYAWGCTLFEAVAGEPPFLPPDVLASLEGGPRPEPDWSRLPRDPRLRALLRACLAEDPAARPAGHRAIRSLLERSAPTRVPTRVVGAPAPPRRRPHRRVAALAALGVAVALGLALVPGDPSPTAAPLVPLDQEQAGLPAASPGDPLGEDLGARLDRELEEALRQRWTPSGKRHPAGAPFFEVLSELGVALLDALPTQVEVLEWIGEGGDPASLSPRSRAALAAHDRAFVELGFPGPFTPFLAPTPPPPRHVDRPDHHDLPALAALPPLPREHPARPDWDRTMLLLTRGLRERRELEVAYGKGELDLPVDTPTRTLAVFTGQAPENLDVLVGSLRASPTGRDRLRELLPEGRELARGYLVAAARTLDHPTLPDALARAEALAEGWVLLNGFCFGPLVSASRVRLLGPAGRTAASWWLQARALEEQALLRGRSLVDVPRLDLEHRRVWRRAVDAAVAEGPPARAARVWRRALEVAHVDGAIEELGQLFSAHASELREALPPDGRRAVDELFLDTVHLGDRTPGRIR